MLFMALRVYAGKGMKFVMFLMSANVNKASGIVLKLVDAWQQ
jgi:hypothetical protein